MLRRASPGAGAAPCGRAGLVLVPARRPVGSAGMVPGASPPNSDCRQTVSRAREGAERGRLPRDEPRRVRHRVRISRQGGFDLARAHYEEGLELARSRGTAEDVALFAFHLGQLWWLEGDLDLGEQYGQEALAVARAAGSTTWTAYALYVLASLAHERGDLRRAGGLYREALALGWAHHDRLCVRMALPGLAGVAAMQGDAARALRLASAASALEENAGMWAFPPIRARQEQWLATAEQALDAASREAAWAEGRRMSMDEVFAHALEDTSAVAGARSEAVPAVRDHLSPREREVLGLVAQGRSNREIADALVVTEHTAKYHVAQLLNKLGAGSRAEEVTRAVAAGWFVSTSD